MTVESFTDCSLARADGRDRRSQRLAATLAGEVLRSLGQQQVATAESITGGRIAGALAAAAGATTSFSGGIVAYRTATKRRLLGVSADSVYCEQAAAEMAIGALGLFDSQFTVATTGIAGPESFDGQRPGTVFVATAGPSGADVVRLRLTGPPSTVIELTHVVALRRLLRTVRRR